MSQMPTPTPPAFNPNAPHMQRPRLRAVRGFAAQTQQGQPILGLADARQVSDKVVYTSPAAQTLLPMMDGSKGLDEMVKQVGKGLTRPILEQLVAQLDEAGLLEGPTFQAMMAKMRADFDATVNLPPASTAAFVDAVASQKVEGEAEPATDAERQALGAARLKNLMDQWITSALKDAPTGEYTELPRAIVAPHIDYPRGWLNYAAAWGRLKGLSRPDRVVILGTNHFGFATGVCGSDKGYETAFGVCEADRDLIAHVRKRLGDAGATKLFENRFDHEREHSIELQVPWIQHMFGPGADGKFPKVFGVLVHDPVANGGESYDGNGLAFDPFVEAMRGAIADVGGSTLIVSSADLSHCGPSFGDQQSLAGETPEAQQAREKVFKHDREMLDLFVAGKADEMVAGMSWQQNPTRWCSIGNMLAAYKITQPEKVQMFNYAAAMDPQGYTFVSSASLAMR